MIDLNRKLKAVADKQFDFTPAPEGEYTLKVIKANPWTDKLIKNLKIIKRDEKGRALKDDKGKNLTEDGGDVTVYNSSIQLEIVGGQHNGKRVFHNISTHPNMPFSIPGFLAGVGLDDVTASEIPDLALGRLCVAQVTVESYTKNVEDKTTGFTNEEVREVNKISWFKAYDEDVLGALKTSDEESEVDGI